MYLESKKYNYIFVCILISFKNFKIVSPATFISIQSLLFKQTIVVTLKFLTDQPIRDVDHGIFYTKSQYQLLVSYLVGNSARIPLVKILLFRRKPSSTSYYCRYKEVVVFSSSDNGKPRLKGKTFHVVDICDYENHQLYLYEI